LVAEGGSFDAFLGSIRIRKNVKNRRLRNP
jgi:hypothetical protein